MIWAIRLHNKRWLGLAAGRPGSVDHGWRPYVWVKDWAGAQQFASRAAAELFLRGLPRLAASGAAEVVQVAASPTEEASHDDGA